jgi:hypothetical protein
VVEFYGDNREGNEMKNLFVVLIAVLMLGGLYGCPPPLIDPNTGKPAAYITCEEAVAYISTVDAALATLAQTFPDQKEYAIARGWYLVARSGAIAFMSKKCPDVLKTVPGAP